MYSTTLDAFSGIRRPPSLPTVAYPRDVTTSRRADAQIQKDIQDELLLEPNIPPASIGVSVSEGVARLTGTVDGESDRRLIETAVRRIAGVQRLLVKLASNPSARVPRPDGDIERECRDVLRSLTDGSGSPIEVMVSNGWVNLSGSVVNAYDRWLAEEKVSDVPGVKGVNGQIRVGPAVW
ncbi:BON domain-containing protein [Noviherbaspirillum galbum]|uniref:BON domain-containing protein n=1 Tax=Noviherbaspirillum galbum TaxID=2709383 RepID=A0A6B3SVX5_9BURK|nr:BON domain-containing protein [Noviherbaspirillum galbum]NEX64651.1 BON domain-containing protein [Noviherbaspirillum galbum]